MKNKKIQLLMMALIFVITMISTLEVKAADKKEDLIADCSYVFTDPKDGGKQLDIRYDYPSHSCSSLTFWGGGCLDIINPNIPLISEDAKAYCPRKMYVKYVGGLGGGYKLALGDADYEATLVSKSTNVTTFEPMVETKEDGKEYLKLCTLATEEAYKKSFNVFVKSHETALANIEKNIESSEYDYDKNVKVLFNDIATQKSYCPYNLSSVKTEADKEIKELIKKTEEVANSKIDYLEKSGAITKEEADKMRKELTSTIDDLGDKEEIQGLPDNTATYNCEGLIDDDLEFVIKWVMNIMKIAVPIILIVLCALDFSQVVLTGDQDAMKKATSKVVKRALAALGFFLVPTIVNMTINWIESDYFDKTNADCSEVINDDSDV